MANPFINISIKPLKGRDIDTFGQLQFENLERISAGRGDNSLNFDSDGLWIGNQYFDQAPFSVDLDGNLIASNALITGQIIAGTGSEVDWSYIQNIVVENAHIESLDAEKITSQIVDAQIANIDFAKIDNVKIGDAHIDGKLSVGATDADVTADNPQNVAWLTDSGAMAKEDEVKRAKLGETIVEGGYLRNDMLDTKVAYISDKAMIGNAIIDEAHIDSLSADDIFTGTLKGIDVISTDGGDDRIELSSGDELKFYAGGSLRGTLRGTTVGTGVALDDGDLSLDNNKSVLINSSGTTNSYGSISITSQDEFWVTTGTDNTFFIKNHDQSQNLATVNSYGDLFARGDFLIQDYNSMKIDGQSTHLKFLNDGLRTAQNYVPFSDNSTRLGASNVRWSDVYAVEVHTGDIDFDNDWVLTESYNMDIEEDGMALVDESGELKYFFGKDKFYTPENVNALEYTRLAKEKKIKKQKDEELT